jgi:hypothetical protein
MLKWAKTNIFSHPLRVGVFRPLVDGERDGSDEGDTSERGGNACVLGCVQLAMRMRMRNQGKAKRSGHAVKADRRTSEEASNALGVVGRFHAMQRAIIRVCLHASLDTVERKGCDSRQDAGAGGSYLGTVALYPGTPLFFANTVLLLRHGTSPNGGSCDILETGLSGHGSRSARVYCVWRVGSFRQWPRDEDQSHQRGRDTMASAADKRCAIKILNSEDSVGCLGRDRQSDTVIRERKSS